MNAMSGGDPAANAVSILVVYWSSGMIVISRVVPGCDDSNASLTLGRNSSSPSKIHRFSVTPPAAGEPTGPDDTAPEGAPGSLDVALGEQAATAMAATSTVARRT